MINSLKETDGKWSLARLLACSIIYGWLVPAIKVSWQSGAMPDIPPYAAGLALMFYFVNKLGAHFVMAVIKKFLGIEKNSGPDA